MSFERSYTLKNDGDCDWPIDTEFVQRVDRSDHDLKSIAVRVDNNVGCVQPGQEVIFRVKVQAPKVEGICNAQFGLTSILRGNFGEPVHIFFQVPKLDEDREIEESLLLANRDKSLNNDLNKNVVAAQQE